MKQLKYILFIFVAFFLSVKAIASNDEYLWDRVRFEKLDQRKEYEISSGTGFYVNKFHIVTSKHVVENCLNIAVRGDFTAPHIVEIYNYYPKEDLAILKSEVHPKSLPFLRKNIGTLKVGDRISTIGYPLDSGKTGNYVAKEHKVTAIKNDIDTGFMLVEFTDNIDHGNSGGPVLDGNSNIIGVVKEKVTYKRDDGTEETFGRALMLDSLLDYLDYFHLRYRTLSSFDILQNYRSDFDARIYVVNIHCIKPKTNEY